MWMLDIIQAYASVYTTTPVSQTHKNASGRAVYSAVDKHVTSSPSISQPTVQ